jgi:hypothetical protein
MDFIDKSSSETSITASIITATEGTIGIACSSSSVKEGGFKPSSSGVCYLAEDEKMLLKKTTDPRPRKMPISSHQGQAGTNSSTSETRTISEPALPVKKVESRSPQVSTRQILQPIRKIPLNSSPLGRGGLPSSSRTEKSHMRSEVLMRSPSYRANAAGKSVFVQDRALSVSLTGSVPPDIERLHSVAPVSNSVFVSADFFAAPTEARLIATSEEILPSVRLEGDVAAIAKSTSLMDCQFLQFESDGEEDW